MRRWSWKTKCTCALAVGLTLFLTYLFFRVRMASGVPVVHTLWNIELASLLKTTAKSVQLLGLMAGSTTLLTALKKWKAKEPYIYVQLLQSAVLGVVSFVAPDLASHCIPVLFGIDL